MNVCKNFVTKHVANEFEISKTDQIAYLNKSVEYFKQNEQFSEKEFTKEVFEDKEVIRSFQEYKAGYQEENRLEIEEDFEISAPAVKKQAKVFKSVLKLDKNFHIYIHGRQDFIEKGTEKDGRKFYKIYYSEES
jgi:ribosome-binding protein aMBF1 (putative translation factor)